MKPTFNINLVHDNIIYVILLKDKEIIEAIFYRNYREPIFTQPSLFEYRAEPSFMLKTYTEHKDCFVCANHRIIKSKEIDAISIDNTWHLFI